MIMVWRVSILILSKEHLRYALPASLFLFLGFIPLFLLSESRFVGLLYKCIPLEKFKPFFDSFQSSFKDEYRFFSGLYFVYGFNILLAFSFTKIITDCYTVVIMMIIAILCLHAVVQPYKKRHHWHHDFFKSYIHKCNDSLYLQTCMQLITSTLFRSWVDCRLYFSLCHFFIYSSWSSEDYFAW